MQRILWLIAVLLIGAAGIWLLNQRAAPESPYPGMGGGFTLRSLQGPVSLSDFHGKLVLIYFGYTSCPDICPTSLGALSAALNKLTPDQMARIQPLFISVDPERDDVEKIAKYSRYFHPRMIGLTGSLEDLRRIADAYGAFFRKAEVEDSVLGYAVDHSSTIYLVGGNGTLVDMIQHSGSPAKIRQRIEKALEAL